MPSVACVPMVIQFLGYDPRPEPSKWPEWLVWYRTRQGMSQVAMAHTLGVASRTLWLWETARERPSLENVLKLKALRERVGRSETF